VKQRKKEIEGRVRSFLDPLTALILRLGFSPDALTFIGLVFSILAGYHLARGRYAISATFLLVGGLCDVLDGSMARRSGRSSRRGAFLDSTLDRLAEIAVFLGLFLHYQNHLILQFLAMLALTGSLMTSYARARAEGLGVDCKVGLMERPERLILMILALYAAPLRIAGIGLLEVVVGALALLTYFTTFQRLAHVLIKLRPGLEGDPRGPENEDMPEGRANIFSVGSRRR
jgi:CDP-diacylglycerol--glycerol-3-phosphate 3-phosphatidyltransferase